MLGNVRRHEIPKLRFFLVQILLIWTGLAIAGTVTETLLLSKLGVKMLPAALLLTSLFTLLGSVSYAALLSTLSSYRLLLATLASSSLALLGAFAGLRLGVEWLCLPLFAFYGASFSLLATQAFGLAGECIDTYSSKRLFPVLSVAATCGELLGGVLVAAGARWLDPSGWLLVWALTFVLALLWLALHRSQLEGWRQTGGRDRDRGQHTAAIITYIRRAAMARALALLLTGMVLCQAFSQYLFSQVFVRNFSSSQDLAMFLGTLVAVTNLAELFLGGFVTPRVVARLGVARAGWVHPLSMLGGLILVTNSFTLVPAVVLWICRRTLQDSIAGPTRNLLYNAIPVRVRGKIRAFLDGVVVSCAQATAALLLLGLQRLLLAEQLCYVALGLACVYVAGARLAGRHYLRTLVGELEGEGLRLQPQAKGAEVAWQPTPTRGNLEALQERLRGSSGEVGTEALNQLANHSDPLALHILGECLGSPRRWLRLGAAQRLGMVGEAGVRAAQGYLHSDRTSTVEAALEVLGCSASAWGRSLLQYELGARIRQAGVAWLVAQRDSSNSLEERFLTEALRQEVTQHLQLAFFALRWLEGEELVETLRLSVAAHGGRRANALEVLSNLGDRSLAQLFVTLLEPNSADDRRSLLQETLEAPTVAEEVLPWALHSAHPWVRRAALHLHVGASPAERYQMEHLLALRQCPPFATMELDPLDRLRESLLEERFPSPALLWRRGESLQRGYVVLQGELPAGTSHFYGGVELVGDLPAREDLVSHGPLRLLAVRKHVLQQAIQRNPGLGLGSFPWLSAELRRCEKALQLA